MKKKKRKQYFLSVLAHQEKGKCIFCQFRLVIDLFCMLSLMRQVGEMHNSSCMCALLDSDYCAELNCVSQKEAYLSGYILYYHKNKKFNLSEF